MGHTEPIWPGRAFKSNGLRPGFDHLRDGRGGKRFSEEGKVQVLRNKVGEKKKLRSHLVLPGIDRELSIQKKGKGGGEALKQKGGEKEFEQSRRIWGGTPGEI